MDPAAPLLAGIYASRNKSARGCVSEDSASGAFHYRTGLPVVVPVARQYRETGTYPGPGMVRKKPLLEQFRENPRNDWQIRDIKRLCDQIGLVLEPPGRGSHYRVYSDRLRDALTIPARRPIKPPYIRSLVSYADAHISFLKEKANDDDD